MEVWNEPSILFKGSSYLDECLEYAKDNGFTLVDRFAHGRGKSSDLLFANNGFLKNG